MGYGDDNDFQKVGKYMGNIGAQAKTNTVYIKAITDLLVEKQIITKEELDSRFNSIYEEESDKIIEFFKGESN
ncbi:hypothetical protein GCM10011409_00300 [Lentibacillus populi]|uniref:Uncharacterized protein n=1 Tax=Lentibacillus populi TaxID=1827502 RepID=A0A9W5X3G1_9BACI|nr:hypothetical protein [Lentibacillus populi]GGB26964.1 hypothetical protein GCM10011409_00300 [Lentibacillus populi]